MRHAPRALLLAGLVALVSVAAPVQADHTETHVQETVAVDADGPLVYTQPGYVTVDCAPQDAGPEDPSCDASVDRPRNPYLCVPSPGPGCVKLF